MSGIEHPFVNQKSNHIKRNSTSDFVGAGSGTVLLMLAKNIPEPSSIKSWLIIIAPTASMGFAWLFEQMKKVWKQYYRQQEIEKLNRRLDINLKAALADPAISEEEKQCLLRKKKKLQLDGIISLAKKIEEMQSNYY